MSDAVPAHPAQLDADGRIDEPIRCLQCGYSLRAMRLEDNCPECGWAVAESTRPDRLYFADPHWLRGVRGGLQLIFWGSLGTMLTAAVDLVIGFEGVLLILFAGGGICCFGMWRFARPEHADAGNGRRILLVSCFAAAWGLHVVDDWLFGLQKLPINLLHGTTNIATIWLFFGQVKALLPRTVVPYWTLPTRVTRDAMIAMIAMFTLLAVGEQIVSLSPEPLPVWPDRIMMLGLLLTGLLAIGFVSTLLWLYVLLGIILHILRREIRGASARPVTSRRA